MYVEIIEVESPNLLHGGLDQEVENVGTRATKSNYGHYIICKFRREIYYLCSAGECVAKFEDRLGWSFFDKTESVRRCTALLLCRTRNHGYVVFYLFKEISIVS